MNMMDVIFCDTTIAGNGTEVPKSCSIALILGRPDLYFEYKFSAILFLRSYKIAGHFHDLAGRVVKNLIKNGVFGRSKTA